MVEDPKNHSGATSLINCSCSASHIQSLGEVRCFTSSRVLHQFNCRVSIHVLPMNDFWKTCSEAATRGVLCKKVFLEISQNSQENTCTRVSFLIKLQVSALLKKRFWHMCFPANFVKFLGTPFLQNTSARLLP